MLREGAAALTAVTRELRGVSSQAREARQQRVWLISVGAVDLMVGVALWYVAALIGDGQWQAGQTLMQEASPVSFARMVKLYDTCGDHGAVSGGLRSHVLTLTPRNDLQAVRRPGRLQLECFRRVRLKSCIARRGVSITSVVLLCAGLVGLAVRNDNSRCSPSCGAALVLRVPVHGRQMPAKANGVRSGSDANQWPDAELADIRAGIRWLLPRGARR
jgi:hypothetical protein